MMEILGTGTNQQLVCLGGVSQERSVSASLQLFCQVLVLQAVLN